MGKEAKKRKKTEKERKRESGKEGTGRGSRGRLFNSLHYSLTHPPAPGRRSLSRSNRTPQPPAPPASTLLRSRQGAARPCGVPAGPRASKLRPQRPAASDTWSPRGSLGLSPDLPAGAGGGGALGIEGASLACIVLSMTTSWDLGAENALGAGFPDLGWPVTPQRHLSSGRRGFRDGVGCGPVYPGGGVRAILRDSPH